MKPDPGHVFVIRGDLRNLACSAWMQTTDKRLRPGGRWEVDIPDAPTRLDPNDRAAFEAERVYAIRVWPRGDAREPVPFLTAVPFYGVSTADEFRPHIRAFVESAVPIARARLTRDRPRPLLGIPPIGFGRGGAHLRKGDVIRMLLDEARTLAVEFEVDIAIVLRDDAKAYALAQHLRKTSGVNAWPELNAGEMDHARRLGGLARMGRLVPFMGAGVSVSAGAPTWSQLIEAAIRKRDREVGLARLVVGYAWDWRTRGNKPGSDFELEGIPFTWNCTDKDWINSPGSLEEVGSIHTVQGYDLNYTGVIIGNDLRYDGRVAVDRAAYRDRKGKENLSQLGRRTTDADLLALVQNIYGVLLTRGILGTYVYVCDPGLREYMRSVIDVGLQAGHA